MHGDMGGAICDCMSINNTWEFNIFWGREARSIFHLWILWVLDSVQSVNELVCSVSSRVGEGMNGRYRNRHSFIHIVASTKFVSDWVNSSTPILKVHFSV